MHLKSRVILGAATAATAIAAALIPATMAAAAAPAVTATWDGQAGGFGVQDGSIVAVAGTGFPASVTVYVSECSTLTGGAADCDADPSNGGVAISQTDASGAFSIPATASAPFIARDETLGSKTCGAGSGCFVVATTNPQAPDPTTNTASAALTFDRLQIAPRTALKNGQLVNITGGGFSPNGTVYISECTSADPSKATQACDFNHIKTVPTDANGAFATTTFQVHTGVVGSDGSKCNPGGSCIVAGTDNVLNPANGHLGGSTVMFAQVKPLSVAAHASVKHIAKGKTFKVIGKATSAGAGVAGLNAVLDKVVNGSLQKVAGAKTVSGGAVTFKITQKKTTTYKVVVAAQKGYAAAASKTFKVATP
jgi:hypothetical protein